MMGNMGGSGDRGSARSFLGSGRRGMDEVDDAVEIVGEEEAIRGGAQ